jgi:hypothetical protein
MMNDTIFIPTRRGILLGLSTLATAPLAPAVVRADSLMPIKTCLGDGFLEFTTEDVISLIPYHGLRMGLPLARWHADRYDVRVQITKRMRKEALRRGMKGIRYVMGDSNAWDYPLSIGQASDQVRYPMGIVPGYKAALIPVAYGGLSRDDV